MFNVADVMAAAAVPLAVAAGAFAVVLAATRRPAAAWNIAVVAGFIASAVALDAKDTGLAEAARRALRPVEAHHKLPLVAIVAALPSLAGWATGRRWMELASAVAAAAIAPLWLLAGGRYLPSQQLRESGFAPDAWGATTAIGVPVAVAAAIVVAWRLWRRDDSDAGAIFRSLTAILALVATAVATALTGSFTYAQLLGAMAASLGGAGVIACIVRTTSSPGSAAGPVLLPAGCLLVLAVGYSELPLAWAIALATALTFAGGWLPLPPHTRPAVKALIRVAVVATIGLVVLGLALRNFTAQLRQQESNRASDPYYTGQ